jgi:hypothetical protein
LAAQQGAQPGSEAPAVTILVESSQDASGKCSVTTNPTSLSVKDGTRIAWRLVNAEGSTGCGTGTRLVLRDIEFRRRGANGSAGPDGSCQVTGADQPGSSDAQRLRRVRRGSLPAPLRCKYTVRVFRGPQEIAMEDPDLEILQ